MYYIPHKWKSGEFISSDKLNTIENGIKENSLHALSSKMVTGSSITINDAADNAPIKSLTVNISKLVQEGSGDPSTSNVRPFSGVSTLYIYDENSNARCVVTFPEEVYEGTLDFNTGLLTVNYKLFTIDGNSALTDINTDSSEFTRVTLVEYRNIGIGNTTFIACDRFICGAPGASNLGLGKVANSATAPRMFFGLPPTVTDLASAKAWFAENPTHIVAQIATPIVYKIDTPILTTKSGVDTFEIDCGNMSLEYYVKNDFLKHINIIEKNIEVNYGANRIDMSKLVAGRLNLDTGEVDYNDYYQTTDYCYIKDFSNLRIFLLKNTGNIGELYGSGFTGRYAFYDINKNLLYTGNSSNNDLPARRPENAAYVRYSFTNTLINGNSQIGLFGRDIRSIWMNYHEEDYHLITELPKKISCIGDSLTAGSYPNILASLLNNNYEVVNNGVGGETSIEIVARQGARPAIVKPFTIPASGSVNIEFISTAIGRNIGTTTSTSNSSFSPVIIAGIEGKINKSNNVYTFTRIDAGDAVTLTRDTPVYCRPAREERDAIQVMWIGTNGGWNETGTYTANNLISQYSQMIDYSSNMNKPYLVLGLHLLPSGANNLTLSELDTAMNMAFGRHFINYREYITTPILNSNNNVISCYGLDDAGITPTSSDLTAINNGNIPPSLMSDSTHLNTAGYTIIGNLVYQRGQELGYWE